jgi:Metallo-beta-lactamase superfamily
MIRLQMLPAEDGDCLLLSYGSPDNLRHILIDGGRPATHLAIRPILERVGVRGERIDVMVATHVDQDHILGLLGLLEDPQTPVTFGDVWFNGYHHLLDGHVETFGPLDGEKFSTLLLNQRQPWNRAFAGNAVEVGHPFVQFDDAVFVHVLSPQRRQLEALAPVWLAECTKEGLIPGYAEQQPKPEGYESFGAVDIDQLADSSFVPDTSKTNASSIAFVFEYDEVRLLFTGDASDRQLVDSLGPLAAAEGGRFRIDALKVAHHGSGRNLSTALLNLIDCPRYLISTSGARHGHPEDVAMARILKYGGAKKEIIFNYKSRASNWDDPSCESRYGYTVRGPDQQDGYVTIDW